MTGAPNASASAASAAASTTGRSAAVATWPSVCPSGISRTPAETMFAAKAESQPKAVARSGTPCQAAAAPQVRPAPLLHAGDGDLLIESPATSGRQGAGYGGIF